MYTCPNCSEVIGDDVRICPFCKHIITDEEYKKAEKNKESMQEQAVQATMDEYKRRVKNEIFITVLFIAINFVGSILLVASGIGQEMVVLFIMIALVCYLAIAWKMRIGFCPYCESLMGRGTLFRTYCPRCGGRLR